MMQLKPILHHGILVSDNDDSDVDDDDATTVVMMMNDDDDDDDDDNYDNDVNIKREQGQCHHHELIKLQYTDVFG